MLGTRHKKGEGRRSTFHCHCSSHTASPDAAMTVTLLPTHTHSQRYNPFPLQYSPRKIQIRLIISTILGYYGKFNSPLSIIKDLRYPGIRKLSVLGDCKPRMHVNKCTHVASMSGANRGPLQPWCRCGHHLTSPLGRAVCSCRLLNIHLFKYSTARHDTKLYIEPFQQLY